MLRQFDHVLVVMPAYNEAAAIDGTVREVLEHLPGATCLVVDDASLDETAALARAAGARVLRLPFNLGVGGAMRAGFRYAVERGFTTVLQIDADGQHDPAHAAELLEELDRGADLVIGARFAGAGDYAVRGPRRWAMVLLAAVLSRTARTRLTDTTSGHRASGPRAVALFAVHYPAEYLGDTIETLVIAARSGLVVRQVPVAMRPRAGGVPSHNPYEAARYLARAALAVAFALIRPASTYSRGSAP